MLPIQRTPLSGNPQLPPQLPTDQRWTTPMMGYPPNPSNPLNPALGPPSVSSGMFVPLSGVPARQPLGPPQPLGQPQRLGRHPMDQLGRPPAGPVFGLTARGEKYPVDLAPYLQQGIPLKISRACEDQNIQFFASKFPEGFDLSDLEAPFSIKRDVSQIEIADQVINRR